MRERETKKKRKQHLYIYKIIYYTDLWDTRVIIIHSIHFRRPHNQKSNSDFWKRQRERNEEEGTSCEK